MQESYKKFHVGDPHGQREGHPQRPHHVWHIYAFSAIQLFFPQKIVYYMLKYMSQGHYALQLLPWTA